MIGGSNYRTIFVLKNANKRGDKLTFNNNVLYLQKIASNN